MPVQTPQYTQNVKDQFSGSPASIGWPKKFFTFALFIFATIFLIYFGLAFGYKAFLKSSVNSLKIEREDLSSQVTVEQKQNLAMLYSQVTNMKSLLREHTLSSQALTLLESITPENVTYLSLNLNTSDGEISIEGLAASYEDLVSQLALLESSPNIERYNLENSNWDSGAVRFQVSLVLVDEVLMPQ